jgi:large subunit ribosomal protein L17
MLANMASSLITHKRIMTTLAKAKALRSYVEPLISKSKEDTTHSRRVVFSYLQDKEATAELFKEVGIKVAGRPGGYTRIIKLAPRMGDNADVAMIELVDFNELLVSDKKVKKAGRSRRGGGTTKAAGEAAAPAKEKAPKAAAPVAIEEAVVEEEIQAPEAAAMEAPEASAENESGEEEKKD